MQQSDQQDEFHGVGGSYVIDPATGLRRRADDIKPDAKTAPLPGDAAAGDAPADPAADQSKSRRK